jgi:predicted Zn-dependent peptidase
MEYKLSKLKNGVRVLTVPMPSFESATITVWIKTGSANEERGVNGISHFLEHMVFKGSPKYPSAKIVSETIDSLGAENNAGTSKEWTNFYIKTASINLEKAFDVLADVVLRPLLKDDEIDRERNVIYEEIAMYEDTPMMDIGEKFESLIYQGSSLGWKIAGDKTTLPNINHDTFESYRSQKYHAENVVISVAGGVSQSEVTELARKYFSDLEPDKTHVPYQTAILKNRNLEIKDRIYLKSKTSDQAHLIIGFLTEGRGYKGRFAQSILTAILGKGMSSRLFTEVREKRGLAYGVRASIDRYQDVGTFDVYAGVTVSKIDEAIKVILNELYGITDRKKKIGRKEFKKAKSYLKGKLALSLEDSGSVGDFFAEQVLFDKEILVPKDLYEGLDKISIPDIYEEAEKLFKKDSVYLAIIGPYEKTDNFVKLLR